MNAIANIIVQLVHVEGPLKGEIQDFFETEILIGRHPDCQVKYPKDLVTISRKHACIQREGNRFRIIDQSTNGTFVNEKPVTEAYLKDGDVIIFSDGGPKLRFRTHASDLSKTAPKATLEKKSIKKSPESILLSASIPSKPESLKPSKTAIPLPKPTSHPASIPPPHNDSIPPEPDIDGEKTKVPFAIQYGQTLKSFQVLPITIGQSEACDLVLNHEDIEDYQAQIFYFQEQYWIKDLTGLSSIYLNGVGVVDQAPLKPDMLLLLSVTGPQFHYLGSGRLVEIETSPQEDDPLEPIAPPEHLEPLENPASPDRSDEAAGSTGKKAGSLFKKFFST